MFKQPHLILFTRKCILMKWRYTQFAAIHQPLHIRGHPRYPTDASGNEMPSPEPYRQIDSYVSSQKGWYTGAATAKKNNMVVSVWDDHQKTRRQHCHTDHERR